MKQLLCLAIIMQVILLAVSKEDYHVPKPHIRVLSPFGFRVSIPHEDGIEMFSFHGNINEPIHIALDLGQFSKGIIKRNKNQWVFVDRCTELKTGDVIYYWVFVVKNGLRYIYNGEFVVKALSTTSTKSFSHQQPPRESTETEQKKTHGIGASCRCPLHHYFVDEIEDLTAKVKKLQEHSRLLQELLEKSQFSSLEMKFEGILPAYEDAAYTAQVIIDVKLGLRVSVVNATRNADNSITFRLATFDDKIAVIRVAKDKLIESKIKLIY